MNRIGFMQGRLSPLVDGRIQAFPREHWRDEFRLARECGLSLMEWTLDQEGLRENPLMTREGRREIRDLSERFGLSVPSLTGDCFMQAPFYKAAGRERTALLDDLQRVVESCGELGVGLVVFPLVDDGRLEDERQEDALRHGLDGVEPLLADAGVRIVFESDFAPEPLAELVAGYPAPVFGINYDTGNSAALGFDPAEEIAAYGERVYNVHVKDRVRGGTTVPLGEGDADFPAAFRALEASGYAGNLILQTARAADGDHAGALCRYRDRVLEWLGGE